LKVVYKAFKHIQSYYIYIYCMEFKGKI